MNRIIQAASQACERAAAATAPFEIRLNQAASYGGACVLVDEAENGQLQAFRHLLLSEMANRQFSPRKNPKKFSPHLTLLRDVSKISTESVEPIAWMAGEVVLVSHYPGQKYDIIGPWPFIG